MQIKLVKLNIKNFKGIKDYTVDFQGKNTNIFGANATGKTTIFDAFKWLLFDKDSSGRKDFCYKTLDSNNKIIHNIESEVEAVIDIDGIQTTLKRVNKENWTKKRGSVEQTFTGNNSEYYIDDVPCKLKDYQEKLNSIIPDEIFKMIVDPTEFCINMSWQKRKEKLFEITGTNISDEDIMKNNEELHLLLDKLEGKSVSDYKKIIAEKITLLNKNMEQIPTRIDEATKSLDNTSEIELISFDELENKKAEYKKQIEEIDNIFLNVAKRAEENSKLVDTLAIKKTELANLQNRIENEQKIKISNKKVDLDNKLNELNNKLSNFTTNIKNFTEKINSFEEQRKTLRAKLDEVKKEYFELDKTKEFICPTCKQTLPEEEIEKQIQQLENNFNENKKTKIEEINNQGKNAKKNQEEYERWLSEHQESIKKIQEEIAKTEIEINHLEEERKLAEASAPFAVGNNEEFKVLCEEVNKLTKQVESIKNETIDEDLKNKKDAAQKEIDSINEVIAKKSTIIKTQERIKELEQEEQDYAQQIQEYQHLKYLTEEFEKIKVDTLEESINKMFSIVKFKLLEEKINGAIQDTCVATVNGVPFADLNNAHKIIAGLDIINTLTKYYKVSAPIFIDNAESIVTRYDIDTQVIRLVVSNNSSLRVEVE